MNITVYDNFKKAVNSTKRPTGGRSISVRLKDNCSVVNPIFRLKSNDKNINYVKWDNNYYNVNDVEFLANEEIAVYCGRDPMATAREDIGNSAQYVVRAASAKDDLVCDMKFPTFNIAVPQRQDLTELQSQISTRGTIVIGIINDTTNNSVSYYAFDPTDSDFKAILAYMFSDAYLDSSVIGLSKEIQKELINPIQYVVSAMWFPISKSSINTFMDVDVKIGWWNTGLSASCIGSNGRIYDDIIDVFNLPRHPQTASHGKYMNGAPFTRYDLHCWTFGDIPIDPLPFVEHNTIRLQVITDLYTGIADLYIDTNNGTVINRQSAQFGVPIQMSQVSKNYLEMGMTTVGAVSSAITSFGAGNIVGGTVGIAQGITSGVMSAIPQVRTVGSIGSKAPFEITPAISCQYYYQVDKDNITMGSPLMKVRQISSLSGYIECSNVDLITSLTPSEKSSVIQMMESGFFYE